MSTQQTVQKAQQYIQELLGRRNYVDFLTIYRESKNAFDAALHNAVDEIAQRYESEGADWSVSDFLEEVYHEARKRLVELEKNVSGIENARVYLEGDFKPFIEEVVQREDNERGGERRF